MKASQEGPFQPGPSPKGPPAKLWNECNHTAKSWSQHLIISVSSSDSFPFRVGYLSILCAPLKEISNICVNDDLLMSLNVGLWSLINNMLSVVNMMLLEVA